MINQLITVGAGLAILLAAYIIDLVAALANVFGEASEDKFSWRKLGRGLAKAFLWAFAVVGLTVELNLLTWFTTNLGFDTTSALAGVDTVATLALIVGASISYAQNTFKNIKLFIENKTPVAELNTEGVNPDYDKIADDVIAFADSITPDWLKGEQSIPDGEKIEGEVGENLDDLFYDSAEVVESHDGDTLTEDDLDAIYARLDETGEGQGSATPLSRRLKNGDKDNGRGWQCSKYSYYLATGIKMNYKPHPDYGPCNGRDMVNFLIKNCGYVKCGKENGAIFSYDNSYWGHTGMVVNAKTNQVSDANYLNALTVGTHTLPLDKLKATYCKPKSSTPTPTPTPAKETLKKGDKVKITAAGNARADGKGATSYGIGLTRYILKVDSKKKYPYQVGSKSGITTGYYKKSALKKVK